MHNMRFSAPSPFALKRKLPYRYEPILVCVVCAYLSQYVLVCFGILTIQAHMGLFKGNSRINNLGMHNMRFWTPSPFAFQKQIPYHYLSVLVCVVCAYQNQYVLVCFGILTIQAHMALFIGIYRINNLGMHNMRYSAPSHFALKKQTTLWLSTCFSMRNMRIPESV